MLRIIVLISGVSFLLCPQYTAASFWDWLEQRNQLFYLRGPWNWSIARHLPELHREFNGIDFGHAHLAETSVQTNDAATIEQARLEILAFSRASPRFRRMRRLSPRPSTASRGPAECV